MVCRRKLYLKRATANMNELAVTVPKPPAVLAAALRDVGVTFELSDKGKYAQALLARAPGLENLIRQPAALEVIANVTGNETTASEKPSKNSSKNDQVNTAPVEDILALARETVPLPHQSAAELPKHGLEVSDIAGILEQLVALGM